MAFKKMNEEELKSFIEQTPRFMEQKEQTVKEWLNTLPNSYRDAAIRNIETPKKSVFFGLDTKVYTILEALDAFDWKESHEGLDFWRNFVLKLGNMSSYNLGSDVSPDYYRDLDLLKAEAKKYSKKSRVLAVSASYEYFGESLEDHVIAGGEDVPGETYTDEETKTSLRTLKKGDCDIILDIPGLTVLMI